MTDFKVGDKVRVIDGDDRWNRGGSFGTPSGFTLNTGDIHMVRVVFNGGFNLGLVADPDGIHWSSERFEKVEEPKVEYTPVTNWTQFHAGDRVEVVGTPYPHTVPNGTVGRVEKVEYGYIRFNGFNFYSHELRLIERGPKYKVNDRVYFDSVPGLEDDYDAGWGTIKAVNYYINGEFDDYSVTVDEDGDTWYFQEEDLTEPPVEEPEPKVERPDYEALVERADALIEAHRIIGGAEDYTAETLADLRDALVQESYRD